MKSPLHNVKQNLRNNIHFEHLRYFELHNIEQSNLPFKCVVKPIGDHNLDGENFSRLAPIEG